MESLKESVSWPLRESSLFFRLLLDSPRLADQLKKISEARGPGRSKERTCLCVCVCVCVCL